MKLGDYVYIKVKVVDRANDNRPKELRGYLVVTSRGSKAYVEPHDILAPIAKDTK